MICPACGEEYEADQVASCPWCGAPGGEASAESGSAEAEGLGPLVRLLEVEEGDELAATTTALERAGIPCFVQAADPLRGFGLSALLSGELREPERREILVPEALLAEAARALGEAGEDE